MEFSELLHTMCERKASDIFISVGAPAYMKLEGKLTPISSQRLEKSDVYNMVYSILTEQQVTEFESTSELNIALKVTGVGRFRVNVFKQMGEIALVARRIDDSSQSVESLGLPSLLKDLVVEPRGLILLVGGTGTGKSTTLAAMINHRNATQHGHILTIEDPVEFVHEHKKSLVHQREVGLDTESYQVALKNAMREAPDVIMIGEIRDTETMKSAIAYAETGHLCLSTLHANNANQAIDRIINFFPDEAHEQVLKDLSLNLRAIVSQRLPVGLDGKRTAAIEVMLNTPYIASLIEKGEISKIKEAMIKGNELGCMTFDQALFNLVRAGKLSEQEALKNADSRNDLSLRFKLEASSSGEVKDIKKEMSFSKFVDFSVYQNYRIKRVNVSDDCLEIADVFDKALVKCFFHKGLANNEGEAELEVQYVLTSKKTKGLELDAIEDTVSSGIAIASELKKTGILGVNIVDLKTNKSVWRLKASREMALKAEGPSKVQRNIEFLFNEFPPPNQT